MSNLPERNGDPATIVEMTGRQKAAILCMLLGKDVAHHITSKLQPDETEIIAYEIAQFDHVPVSLANTVLTEWVETNSAIDAFTIGGVEYARELLEGSFGSQKANQILKRIATQLADTAGLSRLRQSDPQQLSNTIRHEHPQTIAVILANLDQTQTAAIIKELGNEVACDVIYRMARMDKVAAEQLQMVERSLRAENDLELNSGLKAGGPEAVAGILNLLAGSLEKDLIDGLAARDAALCEQIKNLMFVFENVAELDDKSLSRVLRDVDGKTLALALKAAPDEMKTRLMGVLSQRAQQALRDEIEMLGPVRLRDVEAAQASVVEQVRKLEEAGEIVIAKGGDSSDDVVIA